MRLVTSSLRIIDDSGTRCTSISSRIKHDVRPFLVNENHNQFEIHAASLIPFQNTDTLPPATDYPIKDGTKTDLAQFKANTTI
jgi:hypothetical protein